MRDLLRGPQRRSASFADLLAAASDGAPWAVEELARRYLDRLTSFAAARGAADPEGIAAVVLQSVLNRLDRFDFEAPEQFWAYLCLAARSRMIDEHRRTKQVELVGDARAMEGTGTGLSHHADVADAVAERAYISTLLAPLTPAQRRVLELRFLADLSVEETASRTGRSEGAIKGLQRRAISAVLAAMAVALVLLLATRVLGGAPTHRIESDPAGNGAPPAPPESGTRERQQVDGVDGAVPSAGNEEGAPLVEAPGAPTVPTGADRAEDTVGDGSGGLVAEDERFVVTVGSDRASSLATSGQPGPEDSHGVRIRCAVSHISHRDPVRFPERPGPSPALVHWGNTSADAAAGAADLTSIGNVTCDGGTADRSAYAMPALFDERNQVVVPDWVLVEYKSFGGAGFDRSTIQPIPAGLQLVAGPDVSGGADQVRAPSGDERTTTLHVLFPTCVALDRAGRPVLSSTDHRAHLAYQSSGGGPGGDNGCPGTHPYRIPQLSFTVTYRVPLNSAWYLAAGPDPASRHGAATGVAIAAWHPDAMAGMMNCIRNLLDGCWFGTEREAAGQPNLPERFVAPDGHPVYDDSVLLAEAFDRTPFGSLVTPTAGS